MAYNTLSGTVIAATKYLPGDLIVENIVSGNLSTSDGSEIINIPRITSANNNSLVTNVGGDANTYTCESDLTFDGDVFSLVGEMTASIGIKANFFEGDGSRLTGISTGTGSSRLTMTATTHGSILAVGFNFFTGSLGSAVATTTVSVPETPTPIVGDIFYLKAPSNCSDVRKVTIATSGSHTIDGLNNIILESPYGLAAFVYAVSGSWLLF